MEYPLSKEEQEKTGNYGMVAEFGQPGLQNQGPFWITPYGQLIDANGNPVIIGVKS